MFCSFCVKFEKLFVFYEHSFDNRYPSIGYVRLSILPRKQNTDIATLLSNSIHFIFALQRPHAHIRPVTFYKPHHTGQIQIEHISKGFRIFRRRLFHPSDKLNKSSEDPSDLIYLRSSITSTRFFSKSKKTTNNFQTSFVSAILQTPE